LTIQQERDALLEMEYETLERLYQRSPEARDKIANAVGYGTFSNAHMTMVFATAGAGYGSVVDNATGRRTYMRMALGGPGVGLGAKDYRLVMIFTKRGALDKFVESGWELGALADAAATIKETGVQLSLMVDLKSGVEIYSMTEASIVLQASVAGTRYWIDDDLN
jgi:lipid-binding SYLF domain-containing protein